MIAFYELMFNECRPSEAIERYVGAEYIQHNPHVATRKSPFIDYFEPMAREYPGKRVEIKRAIAEGEYVVVHCLQDHDYAAIEILRLTPGAKIVEHWDVLEVRPNQSTNPNGMF